MGRKDNYPLGHSPIVDDVQDFAQHSRHLTEYLTTLGKVWTKHRAKYWKTLPPLLVSVLDETFHECLCDRRGCLEAVHRDWDFCFKHGRAKDG